MRGEMMNAECRMTNDRRLLAFVILISSFVIPARAAPPGFESLFPAGGQSGSSVECVTAELHRTTRKGILGRAVRD